MAQHCPQDNFFLPLCPAKHRIGSTLRLALINTRWLPATWRPCASSFGDAFAQHSNQEFQDFTLIRVLDIYLFQHSHLSSQKMIGSTFKTYMAFNHLLPHPLLPPYCQPPIFHLDYWSHLLTGLLLLLLLLLKQPEWYFKNVSQIMPPLRIFQWLPHLTWVWASEFAMPYKCMIWLLVPFSDLSPCHTPPFLTPGVLSSDQGLYTGCSLCPGH